MSYNNDMLLSCIILSKNEEKNIEKCIESLPKCDEIILLDDNSTDDTVKIATSLGAIVITRTLDDFSSQRNFGLLQAKGEWVLFVDADERLTDELRSEIENVIQLKNNLQGFYIKREDSFMGKKLAFGETAHIYLLRFGKKNKGRWIGNVHETWNILGDTTRLKNPLLHFPHETIDEFIKEINFYTSLRSRELFELGVKSSWFHIFAYPVGKFIYNFIVLQGFRDGLRGFVFSLLMSFHSFLVRARLWLLWQKK